MIYPVDPLFHQPKRYGLAQTIAPPAGRMELDIDIFDEQRKYTIPADGLPKGEAWCSCYWLQTKSPVKCEALSGALAWRLKHLFLYHPHVGELIDPLHDAVVYVQLLQFCGFLQNTGFHTLCHFLRCAVSAT